MQLQKPASAQHPAYLQNPNAEMPVATVAGQDGIGTLEIPRLGLNLPILSEWSAEKLRIAPCRYTGNIYQNNLILCAHNYRKHFGKIRTLNPGDEVIFTDMQGTVFRFQVSEIETVNPNAAENLTAGDWDLTLFTCTVSGTQRTTVRCVRENTGIFER